MKLLERVSMKEVETPKVEDTKITDSDGYEIVYGGLVLYNSSVYKVIRVGNDLDLWNTNGIENHIQPSDVQWLSEDTITEKKKKDKKKLQQLDEFPSIGEFIRRKNGTGRVARVTSKKIGKSGVSIGVEYFYDGAHCTGHLYADEVEPASKPDNWDKNMLRWQSGEICRSTERGRHVDSNGSEYWIGGAGGNGSFNTWPHLRLPDFQRKKKEPEKKDYIERGDLLKEEVKRLQSSPEEKKEEKVSKIKTRKPGEW